MRFISARSSQESEERRNSPEGQAIAAEVLEAVLAAVKAADDAAVTVEQARERGVEVKAPLSVKGIVAEIWPLFATRRGFTKADLNKVIGNATASGKIVPRIANFGNQGGGVRYRIPGPIG